MLVIAPPNCRRDKFFIALALGIPVVHPDWLSDCFRRRDDIQVDYTRYLVPSGIGPRGLCNVQSSSSTSLLDLSDFVIGLLEEGQELSHGTELYIQLATLCKATTIVCTSAVDFSKVDIILSNHFTDLCEQAVKMNIPVVHSEWLIQTIMSRVRLLYFSISLFISKSNYRKNNPRKIFIIFIWIILQVMVRSYS